MNDNLSRLKDTYLNRPHTFHLLLLVLGVAIIYWSVYQFNFLFGWDDQWFVTNHYTENGFTWRNLYAIFTEFYYGQYAPVNQLYYTFLYSLFKYNPAYYHIAGVLIHLANVILIYFLINKIMPKLADKPELQIKQTAFLTALLFAILPINIEPVAWVAASKVTLYVLFYLIALTWYCKYLTYVKSAYFYLTLLFFALSFGAKEQAVLFPVCMFLFDYIYRRKLRDKMVWLEKLPFLILTLLLGIVTVQSQGFEDETRSFYPFFQRIPLAFYTLSEYFTKCLVPINISYLYPFPFRADEQISWYLWIYVFAIPIIVYCFYKQIKIRLIFFGLFFFFIHIVLVINVFSLARFSVIADRYAYLASIGLCFILSYIFISNLYKVKFKIPLFITGVLYVVVLMGYSISHLPVWTNAYTLKEKLKTAIEKRQDFDDLKKLK
ncbi:MAG: hypothetical protein JWR38_475 [Mucilaginibacter sp.]|nr:hypothetical protein [Mucilaginibacter sp.]